MQPLPSLQGSQLDMMRARPPDPELECAFSSALCPTTERRLGELYSMLHIHTFHTNAEDKHGRLSRPASLLSRAERSCIRRAWGKL